MPDNGGWLTPEVAEAQAALVERELSSLPNVAEPYTPFLAAVDYIVRPALLLDVGCGVGHYGTVLRELRPRFVYRGTDFSEAMIEQARRREPTLDFRVKPFLDNRFSAFDIVLLSQCLEITSAPVENLLYVLAYAKRWVILHRLRLGQESGYISEPTYAGYMGHNYLWRLVDLEAFIRDAGRRYQIIPWTRPDMLTMVLWPQT